MLKFGGFRATVNFEGSPKEKKEATKETISGGVYRAYKEEFYGNGSLPEPPRKITPSMIKLPGVKETSTTPKPPPLSAQSVPNLTQAGTSGTNVLSTNDKDKSKSTASIPQPPKQASKAKVSPISAKNQEKELKKLEKQRQAEQKKLQAQQKKREAEQKKLEKKQKADAAKEAKLQAAREAKLKKEREKALKEQSKKEGKKPKPSNTAPPPPKAPKATGVPEVKVTNPLARTANPLAQTSTNTIDSSISRTSGPPPYTDKAETVPNKNDNSGNTSFGKPIEEENSWDFISQHREQMSRPVTVNPMQRKKGGNLEYSVGNTPKLVDGSNSEV